MNLVDDFFYNCGGGFGCHSGGRVAGNVIVVDHIVVVDHSGVNCC